MGLAKMGYLKFLQPFICDEGLGVGEKVNMPQKLKTKGGDDLHMQYFEFYNE